MKLPVNFKSVQTLSQALVMREIRNECRQFMTHDTSKIGRFKQGFWFSFNYLPAVARGEMKAWLIYDDQTPIGYGIISKRNGKWWVSGGITEVFRGQGYGRELFKLLTYEARRRAKTVWLDLRSDNFPAFELYKSLGYKVVKGDKDMTVMKHN